MLNSLLAQMSDGVYAEVGEGGIALLNDAFSRIFDVPAPPWPPESVASLRHAAFDRIEPPSGLTAASATGASPAGEVRLKNGRLLEQHQFAVPLADGRTIHVWQFRDITDRRKKEEELDRSRRRLRHLSSRLEAAREEERRSLAHTLHDEVGQLLTGLRLEITSAVEKFRQAGTPAAVPVVDRLQAAVGLIDLSVAAVQRVATALRPPLFDHPELLSAIRWEAAIFQARTGIRCRVSAGDVQLDDRAQTTTLHRILLEALTNVARHAHAGTVWIQVRRHGDRVTMEVRDNGKGIDEESLTRPGAMGLLGMRERAFAAGGELRISRRRAGGTSVVVTLPLTQPAQSWHERD